MDISPISKFLNLYHFKNNGSTQLWDVKKEYQNYPLFNNAFINRKSSMATMKVRRNFYFSFSCCDKTLTKTTGDRYLEYILQSSTERAQGRHSTTAKWLVLHNAQLSFLNSPGPPPRAEPSLTNHLSRKHPHRHVGKPSRGRQFVSWGFPCPRWFHFVPGWQKLANTTRGIHANCPCTC